MTFIRGSAKHRSARKVLPLSSGKFISYFLLVHKFPMMDSSLLGESLSCLCVLLAMSFFSLGLCGVRIWEELLHFFPAMIEGRHGKRPTSSHSIEP